MIRPLTASLSALALVGCTVTPPLATAPEQSAPAFTGAVSAADPRAQAAGEEMLARGGSATDAALAVMLALTVVEPQSSGIGGGGFLVRGTADGAVATYDGRETAPAGANPEWFLDANGELPPYIESVRSGLSVGVPGNIALAAKAHAAHGKLAWAALFDPAIRLAREGFAINPRLNGMLERAKNRSAHSAEARTMFFDATGKPLPVGTLVTNERLARTFEAIAQAGPSAFYSGDLAREIAATVAADTPRDGAMTYTDITDYSAKTRDAVCGTYRAYRVCTMGPPTSGGVAVLQILGQLERFDLTALGAENPVTWHLFVESQRLAYADRELYLADSDYVSVPVAGLIDPDYLAERSALIADDGRLAEVEAGTPVGAPAALADGDEPEEKGTSHFAVVDADDTMVSYTSTIEGPFGSGLMAGGFFLNNELTDFSRSPVVDGRLVANRVEGGKRPRSSMAPTIVWDPAGRPFLAVGAAGGGTIPVQTARSIIGAIDFGLSAEDILGLPFIMAFGDRVLLEKGTWLEAQADAFKALGHAEIIPRAAPVKGGAVLRTPDGWQSARDPRLAGQIESP
ncbi:gamma-glutamyltransferase [Erythrobacter sp.]|uniref:gamma-glutamyltransferase n=1 Tax=Erythrobacter sp. TaxID=1042 RepID=UPI001B29C40C|nr:gamma-glutamyltransferase [Erythrobacter sp.]MBO6528119.1 gamma-glutamyltransferase [Erythrobacter sp.]MBO6530879.1 gamma-glutamyltransferase [Erythrobacter sp.]